MKGQRPRLSLRPPRVLNVDGGDGARYSQSYEEMDSLELPGEEPGPAKISYHHRQEILMERGKKA